MTTKILDFKVQKKDQKKRLDKFLSEKFKNYSRSHLQKLIEDGFVLVNKSKKEKKYKLKEGDEIKIFLKQKEEPSLDPDCSISFNVIFENKDFLVLEKPAGLVVHPSLSHKKGTLVNGLLAKYPKIKNVGEDPLRPGIVHRLDKDTSGLMVIAKTDEAFFWLKSQFKEKKVKKTYTALVFGNIKENKGTIKAKIARSGQKQITLGRGRHKKIRKTKEAETEFKVKKHIDKFTLVEAYPKTGRMHQIRVHFAHIGHPLVGDKKYAPKKLLKIFPQKRHFLHASKIEFADKNGKKYRFFSELPEDLKRVIKDCISSLQNGNF